MTKARCTGCDFIVEANDDGTAEAHYFYFTPCPGTGKPTENPSRKTF
jgi:hypothetical protein